MELNAMPRLSNCNITQKKEARRLPVYSGEISHVTCSSVHENVGS